MRPLSRALLTALVAAVAGCGGGDSSSSEESRTDRLIQEGRVVLEIGELDGPIEEVFGRIGGIAEDDTGRIYVADLQSDEVRAFDSSDGSFRFLIARRGEGPGEVESPCCLAVGPNGDLWVRDIGNGRYQVFRVGENGVQESRTVRMANRSPGYWAPVTFVGDSVVDVGMGTDPNLYRFIVPPNDGEPRRQLVPQPGAEELGAAVIDTEVNGDRARFFFWPPHGPQYLSAHGPRGLWADAVSSSYRVWLRTTDGDSILIERPGVEGPPLSGQEREEAAERISRDRERAGGQSNQIDWGVPQRKQPLEELFFDRAGRLWVQRSVEQGTDREADLYSPEGEYLETRTWPWSVRLGVPGWADEWSALGTTSDSLGVQTLVRVEWEY